MAYAFGYGFGVDNDLVYDFLLGAGDIVNSTGLEVIKKKVKPKVGRSYSLKKGLRKDFGKKVFRIKFKIVMEDGTVYKATHQQQIKAKCKLVSVDESKLEGGGQGDATEEVLKQLEEAFGVKGGKKEEKAQKQIGFKLD